MQYVVQSCTSFKRLLACFLALSVTRSFIHSFIHSLTDWLIDSFIHSFICSLSASVGLIVLHNDSATRCRIRESVPHPLTHKYKQNVSSHVNNLLALRRMDFVAGSTWPRIPLGNLLSDKASVPLFPIFESHFVDLTLAVRTQICSRRWRW
jgi:hypothetical protein